MFTRDGLKRLLIWIGALVGFSGVMPYFFVRVGTTADAAMAEHLTANPQDWPKLHEYRFGWPSSPLFHYRSEQTLRKLADGNYLPTVTTSTVFGVVSLSALSLVIGVTLIAAGTRLPPSMGTHALSGDQNAHWSGEDRDPVGPDFTGPGESNSQ